VVERCDRDRANLSNQRAAAMSRLRECEGGDDGPCLYWANLVRQTKSQRGQAFLRELLVALEALPDKKLIENAIVQDGCSCSLGALAVHRRVAAGENRDAVLAELAAINVDIDDSAWDGEEILPWATHALAAPFYLADQIASINDDEGGNDETRSTARYDRMVKWLQSQIFEIDVAREVES